MPKSEKPKWQKEVEAILRRDSKKDELPQIYPELIDTAQGIEVPSGDTGKVVATLLKTVSQELYPLAASYASFQLGVAWERCNRKDDAR